jgi:hypothetical protein
VTVSHELERGAGRSTVVVTDSHQFRKIPEVGQLLEAGIEAQVSAVRSEKELRMVPVKLALDTSSFLQEVKHDKTMSHTRY